jgi:hypothetical protein
MANTLDKLSTTLYSALDEVSRELVGYIPVVARDSTYDRAAVGQEVTSFVTPTPTAYDIAPGVTAPNTGDQTIGNVVVKITKSRAIPIRWNGEEAKAINNSGPGRGAILRDQFKQAMRSLVNEMETDLGITAALKASRALGTAGSNPFASDFYATADAKKLLDDNGCDISDRHMVLNTTSGAAIRKLPNLFKVNESGDRDILTQGKLINLNGFDLRESAKTPTVAAGTASGATTNSAGYAVGATVITLAAAGTGTVIPGDIVLFAGDSNKYVVESGDADVSNGGTITLAKPGIQVAMSAAAKNITVTAASPRMTFFRRNALLLATRAPALPEEGDMADDAMFITDPVSGLSFEVRLYKQYRQVLYEVAAAWGTGGVKTENVGVLLGL